ncbi:MAG: hypothetical protein GYA24_04435, partial [Candidatus Lokiarchaeota archaeon]|nr:hypothetical protein [Candidatus Lokiarchaeota archaeon]
VSAKYPVPVDKCKAICMAYVKGNGYVLSRMETVPEDDGKEGAATTIGGAAEREKIAAAIDRLKMRL